jgi:transposase
MARPSRFSPEVRDRAVRMVLEQQDKHDSQWAAITSIAEKLGCTAETLLPFRCPFLAVSVLLR